MTGSDDSVNQDAELNNNNEVSNNNNKDNSTDKITTKGGNDQDSLQSVISEHVVTKIPQQTKKFEKPVRKKTNSVSHIPEDHLVSPRGLKGNDPSARTFPVRRGGSECGETGSISSPSTSNRSSKTLPSISLNDDEASSKNSKSSEHKEDEKTINSKASPSRNVPSPATKPPPNSSAEGRKEDQNVEKNEQEQKAEKKEDEKVEKKEEDLKTPSKKVEDQKDDKKEDDKKEDDKKEDEKVEKKEEDLKTPSKKVEDQKDENKEGEKKEDENKEGEKKEGEKKEDENKEGEKKESEKKEDEKKEDEKKEGEKKEGEKKEGEKKEDEKKQDQKEDKTTSKVPSKTLPNLPPKPEERRDSKILPIPPAKPDDLTPPKLALKPMKSEEVIPTLSAQKKNDPASKTLPTPPKKPAPSNSNPNRMSTGTSQPAVPPIKDPSPRSSLRLENEPDEKTTPRTDNTQNTSTDSMGNRRAPPKRAPPQAPSNPTSPSSSFLKLSPPVSATSSNRSSVSRVYLGNSVLSKRVSLDEKTMAAVAIQSWFRGLEPQLAWKKHKARLSKRRNIALEILSTEKAYVNHLEDLINVYFKPLIEEKSHLLQENTIHSYKNLTSQITIIRAYNLEFLAEVEKKILSWDNATTTLGDSFSKHSHFFRVYTQYVNTYSDCHVALHNSKKKSQQLVDWLNEVRHGLTGLHDIDDLLIMPVQRIPRYSLLITDLLKNTTSDHPDFQSLGDACKKINSVAEHLNNEKKKLDEIHKVAEVFSSIKGMTSGFKLLDVKRKVIRSGELIRIWSPIDNPDKTIKKALFAFLFSDMIIVTKKPKKGEYAFLSLDYLDALHLRAGDHQGTKCISVLRQKPPPDEPRSFKLLAEKEKETVEWEELMIQLRETYLDEKSREIVNKRKTFVHEELEEIKKLNIPPPTSNKKADPKKNAKPEKPKDSNDKDAIDDIISFSQKFFHHKGKKVGGLEELEAKQKKKEKEKEKGFGLSLPARFKGSRKASPSAASLFSDHKEEGDEPSHPELKPSGAPLAINPAMLKGVLKSSGKGTSTVGKPPGPQQHPPSAANPPVFKPAYPTSKPTVSFPNKPTAVNKPALKPPLKPVPAADSPERMAIRHTVSSKAIVQKKTFTSTNNELVKPTPAELADPPLPSTTEKTNSVDTPKRGEKTLRGLKTFFKGSSKTLSTPSTPTPAPPPQTSKPRGSQGHGTAPSIDRFN